MKSLVLAAGLLALCAPAAAQAQDINSYHLRSIRRTQRVMSDHLMELQRRQMGYGNMPYSTGYPQPVSNPYRGYPARLPYGSTIPTIPASYGYGGYGYPQPPIIIVDTPIEWDEPLPTYHPSRGYFNKPSGSERGPSQ